MALTQLLHPSTLLGESVRTQGETLSNRQGCQAGGMGGGAVGIQKSWFLQSVHEVGLPSPLPLPLTLWSQLLTLTHAQPMIPSAANSQNLPLLRPLVARQLQAGPTLSTWNHRQSHV